MKYKEISTERKKQSTISRAKLKIYTKLSSITLRCGQEKISTTITKVDVEIIFSQIYNFTTKLRSLGNFLQNSKFFQQHNSSTKMSRFISFIEQKQSGICKRIENNGRTEDRLIEKINTTTNEEIIDTLYKEMG